MIRERTQPRPVQDVNQRILDRILRYQHGLESHERAQLEAALRPLARAEEQIQRVMDQIVRRSRSTLSPEQGIAQYRNELPRLRQIYFEALQDLEDSIGKQLRSTLLRELQNQGSIFAGEIFKASGGLINATIPTVPSSMIGAIISEPIAGQAWAARLSASLGEGSLVQLQRSVETAFLQGDPPDVLARHVKFMFDGDRKRALRLARTELNRLQNRSQQIVYSENQHLLAAQRFVATLDRKTSLICAHYDGNVYYYDPVPENEAGIADAPQLPLHPNERSSYSPVTKAAQILGLPPGRRASFSGSVPAREKYPDWFGRQDPTWQRQHLGPSRYAMYKSGKLDVDEFAVGDKVLNLDQLNGLAQAA